MYDRGEYSSNTLRHSQEYLSHIQLRQVKTAVLQCILKFKRDGILNCQFWAKLSVLKISDNMGFQPENYLLRI